MKIKHYLLYLFVSALILGAGMGQAMATGATWMQIQKTNNQIIDTYFLKYTVRWNGRPEIQPPEAQTVFEVWTSGNCTGRFAGGNVPLGVSAIVFHSPNGSVSYSNSKDAVSLWQNGLQVPLFKILFIDPAQDVTTCEPGPDPGATDYAIVLGNMRFSSAEVNPSIVGWSTSQQRVDFQVQTRPVSRPVNCVVTAPPTSADRLSARLWGSPVQALKMERPFEAYIDTENRLIYRSFPADDFLCSDIGTEDRIFSADFDN